MTNKLLLVLIAILSLTGCVKRIAPPKPVAGALEPEAAWAKLLQEHVTDTGKIDFAAVKKAPDDLNAYVAWIAENGPASTPEKFPTREAKFAYYLNAYNAVCMFNAINNSVKPEAKFRFFLRTRLRIDRTDMSLYDLENEIVRPTFKDPRAHFILNCMVKGCPRLPREPMRAETLEAQLDAAAKLFFSEEPRNVDVKDDGKIVRLSSILKFYTADFLKPNTGASTLIEYANQYREKKIPADYKVAFIPYDWTLNQK